MIEFTNFSSPWKSHTHKVRTHKVRFAAFFTFHTWLLPKSYPRQKVQISLKILSRGSIWFLKNFVEHHWISYFFDKNVMVVYIRHTSEGTIFCCYRFCCGTSASKEFIVPFWIKFFNFLRPENIMRKSVDKYLEPLFPSWIHLLWFFHSNVSICTSPFRTTIPWCKMHKSNGRRKPCNRPRDDIQGTRHLPAFFGGGTQSPAIFLARSAQKRYRRRCFRVFSFSLEKSFLKIK